jgi:hypothetical protein
MAIDITEDLIERLIKNGREAYTVGMAVSEETGGSPAAQVAGDEAKLMWFYSKARSRGPWDFKNNVFQSYKQRGVKVAGRDYGIIMPGNLNFGFAGAALGLTVNVLHGGGAWAQRQSGPRGSEFWCIDGEDPADFEYIKMGIELYRQVKLGVTYSNLEMVLGQFHKVEAPKPKVEKGKPGEG